MLIELSGRVTLEELEQMRDESWQLAESGVQPVHAIVDLSKVDSVPYDLAKVTRAMSSGSPDSKGFAILIIKNRLVRFLVETIYQILKLDMRNADDVESAVSMLKLIDRTLTDHEPETLNSDYDVT